MQLLFESSEEFGYSKGLNFIRGTVNQFPSALSDKLPHVSWNSIERKWMDSEEGILRGISDKNDFYFVHSYICNPKDNKIITSTANYGKINFCSSLQLDNIYASQFHPEKSANNGLMVLQNFINIVKKGL